MAEDQRRMLLGSGQVLLNPMTVLMALEKALRDLAARRHSANGINQDR